jgi:transposase
MLKEEHISSQVLDHLGLLASVIDKIGLVEKIDHRLPVSSRHGAKVTMGQRVAAMVLNGLGFMDDRLYMFPEFLENKPVDRLFGSDVQAAYFNDDSLGRCLDALSEYGVTKLFSELAFEIGLEQRLLGSTVHVDTTSLTVFGSYEEQDALAKKNDFKVDYGYSKDHRPDLKQMILHLATTGASAFPVWMEAHSGNASDKVVLQKAAARMKAFCAQLKAAPSFLFVGDSALYEKCVAEAAHSQTERPMLWLSRVPSTIKEAKTLLALPDQAVNWTQLDAGYKIHACVSRYGNVPQRWLLVFSEQAYTREGATLDRTVQKEYAAMEQKIDALSRTVFNCTEDANKALALFSKSLKYHTVQANIQETTGYQNPGRPSKRAQPVVLGYTIQGKLIPHAEKIAAIRLQKGRFILATNQLDAHALPAEDMLKEYKNQNKTEVSFRFIKGNAFEVSSVFLKKESRIQALMMVMTLCLMIYSLSEYWVRNALSHHQATIPNQLKKPTQKPTMAYVCRLFHGIHVWCIQWEGYVQQCVVNLKAVTKQIIGYFGLKAMEIYGLKPS